MDHNYCALVPPPFRRELSRGLVYSKEIFGSDPSGGGDILQELSVGSSKSNRWDKTDGLIAYEKSFRAVENVAKQIRGPVEDIEEMDVELPEGMNFRSEDLRLYQAAFTVLKEARLHQISRQNESDGYQLWEEVGANHLRKIFAAVRWSKSLLAGLHKQLVAQLPLEMLTLYLIIVRRLHLNAPTLTKRLLADEQNQLVCQFVLSTEPKKTVCGEMSTAMNIPSLTKPSLFLIVTPLKSSRSGATVKRFLSFCSVHLTTLGECMEMSFAPNEYDLTLEEFFNEAADSLAEQLEALKIVHNDKQLVLVGCGSAAALCIKASQVSPVDMVICFSFPHVTIVGVRGDVDDDLLLQKVPTLVVVGQFAPNCIIDDLKDSLSVLKVPAGLIVLGHSDEKLITDRTKLILSHISQDTVDLCLLKSIAEFVNFIFTPPSELDLKHSRPQVARRSSKKAERLQEIIRIVSSSEDEVKPPIEAVGVEPVAEDPPVELKIEAPPPAALPEELPPRPLMLPKLSEALAAASLPLAPMNKQPSATQPAEEVSIGKPPSPRYSMALQTASKIVAAAKLSGVTVDSSVNTVIDIS